MENDDCVEEEVVLRSEPANTKTGGKKVRQHTKRGKGRSKQSPTQPRQFQAPGTEVRK